MKTSSSSTVSMPNPTALLFLLAVIVAWFTLWKEEPDSGVLLGVIVAVCVALAPFLIYAVSVKPIRGAIVLIAATAMPHLFVTIGGLKARPEHIVCGILLFALPFWFRKRQNPLVWMTADYLVLTYIAMNFFSSTFMSIEPGQTIKWCVQQAVAMLPYFIVRFFANDKVSFQRAFHILLAIGAAEAVYAILCFYSNLFFGSSIGVEIGQYGTFPGTYGLQYEANLLGAYCGAAMVMSFYMYLWEQKKFYVYTFALSFAALSISLSRGALLATGIAFVAFCLRAWRLQLFRKAVVLRLAKAMLYTGIVIVPTMYTLWSARFSNLNLSQLPDVAAGAVSGEPPPADTSSDPSEALELDIALRFLPLGFAAEGIIAHPFLGNGTSSYQLQYSSSDLGVGDESGWLGNTELRVQYDTGLVGLAVFLAFLVVLALNVKKEVKKKPIPQLEALTIACLLYCVSFQFTEGTLLAFFWLHMGLIAAGIAMVRGIRKREALIPAADFS